MIIDVHTHGHQPEHWGDEYSKHWQPAYGGSPYPRVAPADFDRAMSEGGVDVAVVFGLAATRAGVHTPLDYLQEFVSQLVTPTISLAAIDPTDENWRDQCEAAIAAGCQGLKLYPVLAHFDPLSPRGDELFRMLASRNKLVLWHMGATPSPAGALRLSQPLLIDEVAQRHPDLTQVIAHVGHPWQRDTAVVLRKNRRVFADVSGLPSRTMEAYQSLILAQEWGIVDSLVFGSDYPLWTPRDAIDALWNLTTISVGDLPRVSRETVESVIYADALATLCLTDPRRESS